MIDQQDEREMSLIERYEAEQNRLRLARDRLGPLKALKFFPYGPQLLSIIILFILGIVFIKYAPDLTDWMMESWFKKDAAKRNMFVASIILNMGLLSLMGIIWIFSGVMVKTWLKSWITRKPVTAIFTDSRTVEFVIPKKARKSVWEIDKESCVESKMERVFIGPHKVPIGVATPESPVLIDIMEKGKGSDNWDMSRIHMFGQQKDSEARDSMRTGSDMWLKFMPWVIVLVAIGLIFYPLASRKISESGKISDLQDEVLMYRKALADAGINPNTISPLMKPSQVTVTTTTLPPRDQPAQTGVSIGPGVSNG